MKKILIISLSIITFFGYSQTLIGPLSTPVTSVVNDANTKPTSTGGTNTYTATLPGTGYPSADADFYTYLTDRVITFKFTNAATSGPFTLNINGKGAKVIKKKDATGTVVDITTADIPAANTILPIRYNGTYLVIEGGSGAKVADEINDGETTVAPSQNAVYNALILKANSLVNGNGTTVNGDGINWEGEITKDTYINGNYILCFGLSTPLAVFQVITSDLEFNVSNILNFDAVTLNILTSGSQSAAFTSTNTTFSKPIIFKAGSTAANTYPFRMQSGSLLTTPVVGVHEFLTDKFYTTITTGTARKEFTLNDAALTSGTTPVATTNGRLTDGLIISQGTYTPTLTSVANVAASTAYSCQYMRVGNVVTVSGRVDIDPTNTSTTTSLGVSLPISSNIANTNELGGSGAAPGVAGQVVGILGDATNDRAQIQWMSVDVSNQAHYFTFTYRII